MLEISSCWNNQVIKLVGLFGLAYNHHIMEILIVNLPASYEKRAYIQAECDKFGLDYEIIDAIHGKALSEAQVHALVNDYPACSLTLGEIGCALSHIAIYKKMVDEGIPIALVLEDDAILGDGLAEVLDALKARDDNQREQVYLLSESYYYIKQPNSPLCSGMTLNRVISAYYTYGYVINLKAAQALYEFLRPVRFEADRWTYFQQCGLLRIDCVVPPVVTTVDESKQLSSIHNEREALAAQRKAYYKKLKRQIPAGKIIKRAVWRVYAHIFCSVYKR